MAKKTKEPKPRTNKAEQLRDDRLAAMGRSLSAQRLKLRKLKADFDAADVQGRAALQVGDVRKFGDAVDRERAAIEKHSSIIKAHIESQAKRKRR